MAGRIKHMERSHRSHRNTTAIFGNFVRNTYVRDYTNKYFKMQRMSIGQKLARMLAPLKQALSTSK